MCNCGCGPDENEVNRLQGRAKAAGSAVLFLMPALLAFAPAGLHPSAWLLSGVILFQVCLAGGAVWLTVQRRQLLSQN